MGFNSAFKGLNIGVEFALDDEGKKVAAPRARLMTD
jgi:hypothetical protein